VLVVERHRRHPGPDVGDDERGDGQACKAWTPALSEQVAGRGLLHVYRVGHVRRHQQELRHVERVLQTREAPQERRAFGEDQEEVEEDGREEA
jgi:hypothetical protein